MTQTLMELGTSPMHGVTLAQYAAVHAALGEEFSLEEVLHKERIDAYDFQRADAKWKARLAHESSETIGVVAAYQDALAVAEDRLARKVSPIDTDAAAWAAFFAAYTATADRARMLIRSKMNANDVSRLQRAWQKQAAQNPDILSRLEGVSTSTPLPQIEVGARVLRRSLPQSIEATVGRSGEASIILSNQKAPGARPLRRVEAFGLDRYAAFRAELEIFPKETVRLRAKYDIESEDIATALINEFRTWIDEDPERTRAYRRLRATALDRARKIAETTTAAEREESTHAPTPEVVRREKPIEPLSLGQVYTPAPNPLPQSAEKQPPEIPATPLENATQDVESLLAGAALPFAKDFSAPEVAAARAERIANATQGPQSETPHAGGTQDVSSLLQKATLPFQHLHKGSTTKSGGPTELPIPERPLERAAIPAFPDLSLDQYAALCAERDMAPERSGDVLTRYHVLPDAASAFFGLWKSRLTKDPALAASYTQAYTRYSSWFAQRARPATISLTLEQYASLSVDLSIAPARHAETLARYRLTTEDKAAVDKHYQQRFASDPALRIAFDQSTRAYSAWLAQSRRT